MEVAVVAAAAVVLARDVPVLALVRVADVNVFIPSINPDLPSRAFLERQARRLEPMRSRSLRRLGIAHRGPVLDLGAAYGVVSAELASRCKGPVIALDRNLAALRCAGDPRVLGEARSLPFADRTFDVVFAQLFFLWAHVESSIIHEIKRVLQPGGVLFAIEPDFGGMIEHPPESALGERWVKALRAAGADPLIGRKLVLALRAAGLRVRVDLLPTLTEASDDHAADLGELLGETVSPFAQDSIVHLPYFFISADICDT